MKTKLHWIATIATLAGITAVTSTAQAQSAGSWILRGGATHLAPDVKSGDMSAPAIPGTKVDVNNDTKLSGGLTYMLTDNLSLDLPLALPFKHNIVGAGAIAGVGTLATVKALPVTLFLQYRFNEANAVWRPYLGAGVTYSRLYDETSTAALSGITGGSPANPTTLSADSRFGLTLQAGLTYKVDEHWFLDGAVVKSYAKTKATLSTNQTIDVKLDPLVFMVGVGYKF